MRTELYKKIKNNKLIGTMKFCLKNFPEDFLNNTQNINTACYIAHYYDDTKIFFMIKNINSNIKNIKSTHFNKILPKLLKQNFFNDITISTEEFKFYINRIIILDSYKMDLHNKYLIFNNFSIDNVNIDVYQPIIDNINKLPVKFIKKFIKTYPINSSNEDKLNLINKLTHRTDLIKLVFKYNNIKLDWNYILNELRFTQVKYYILLSIINASNKFNNITTSYESMKKAFTNKTKTDTDTLLKQYHDTLFKQYTESTYMKEFINNTYNNENSFNIDVSNLPNEHTYQRLDYDRQVIDTRIRQMQMQTNEMQTIERYRRRRINPLIHITS